MLKNFLRVSFVILIAVCIFVFYKFGFNDYLTAENISSTCDYLVTNFGIFIPFVLVALYILFNIIGFPTMYFSMLLGYLYGINSSGFVIALFIAWLGMTLGIVASFINSRYLFRDIFIKKFGETDIVKKLETEIQKKKFITVLMTRLFFIIPYNAQNYAYGLTSINFSTYIVGTALGILPITIMNVMFGRLLYSGNIMNANIGIIMAVVSVTLVVILSIYLTRKLILKK